jgi:hypothetical protein
VKQRSLTATESHSVVALLMLMPLLTAYWVVNTQEWNTYNIWARDHVDLLYDHWSATDFWLLHAGIVAAAGMLFPVFGKSLRRLSAQ